MNPLTPSIVLVRQRPAFGDALLLSPLINQIRKKYSDRLTLTVITDNQYAAGALPSIFRCLPGVDRVINVPQSEWTTDSNRAIDSWIPPHTTIPPVIKRAKEVYDCNGAFMWYEREHNGDPPLSISEFWLQYNGFKQYTVEETLPKFNIPLEDKLSATSWLSTKELEEKKYVCIVLKSGDKVRDWGVEKKINVLIDFFWTRGIKVVTIDPTMTIDHHYAISLVGRQLPFVAEVLRSAMYVITPDTGILHLAQSVNCPIVAIWGIMRPELRLKGYNYILAPSASLGVCEKDDYDCRCWQFQRWSCLLRLQASHIIRACEERERNL